jgi:methionyl-tRNA formyltransferase
VKVVFMGSAPLSCATLDALAACDFCELCAVVTQPDRPRGRRLQAASCASKARAMDLGIPVLTPVDVNAPESIDHIKRLAADVVVVVAYGQILKPQLLSLVPDGFINVHTSLLPRYRGAAPIQWAVVRGETETGVTTMRMDAGMDTGDMLLQRATPIGPGETAGDLHDRLAVLGAELLVETLARWQAGTLEAIPQRDADATLAPKLSKQDGRMDWTQSAGDLYNRVRGLNPWPVCWCQGPGKLRVWEAEAVPGAGKPGTLLEFDDDCPVVACGSGALRLVTLQPEGGRQMNGADYVRGHRLKPGDRFE